MQQKRRVQAQAKVFNCLRLSCFIRTYAAR